MKLVDLVGLHVEAASGAPLVLLREHDEPHRVLPIFIGTPEAAAIAIALGGGQPPRPLTHDLMATLVDTLGASVESVELTEVHEGTFVAALFVSNFEPTPLTGGRATLVLPPGMSLASGESAVKDVATIPPASATDIARPPVFASDPSTFATRPSIRTITMPPSWAATKAPTNVTTMFTIQPSTPRFFVHASWIPTTSAAAR